MGKAEVEAFEDLYLSITHTKYHPAQSLSRYSDIGDASSLRQEAALVFFGVFVAAEYGRRFADADMRQEGRLAQQCGTDRRMLISPRAAYEQFRREPGCCYNSYDWYRQRAQREGIVSFGSRRQLVPTSESGVPVAKVKGQWMVDQRDVDAELAEHQASRAELEQITADYYNRILHGAPGSTIRTSFGSYTVLSDFHSIWRSDAKPWKDSGLYWFCRRCWQTATLARDKPECHTCSDWGSCGRDCTLSEVSCPACGTAMAI